MTTLPTTHIRVLYLTLTAGCNLSCAYCYQSDKKPRRMEWDTAKGAVDLLFASSQEEIELVFFGGEPLLEFPLIRQVVAYGQEHCPKDKRLRFGLITNGTLLREEALDFVARHRFGTLLSFDGVPAAQDIRGRGTFKVLDGLLDRMRRHHPAFLRHHLEVGSTLTPRSIPFIVPSFRYFLGKGLKKVSFSPDFTGSSTWTDEMFPVLEDQFAALIEESLKHYVRSGEIPFTGFRGKDTGDPHRPQGRTMCGVTRAETPTVDVDGQMHGCATFTESFQRFPSEFLQSRITSMRMGDFRDPDFAERYRAFPEAARQAEFFHHKQKKYSSYGKCGKCRFLADCSVCPTSIGHIPGNTDPHRVPDFACAYNLICLAARQRFRAACVDIQPPVTGSRHLQAVATGME